ncbi:hypothetical protein BVX94_00760 [bacterium B17]|nr:hypothetical protein BVX94_00760 [bacterium B17]
MSNSRDLGSIVAHIPGRGGSKRCPAKNLRMLCGKPMMAYAIECAQASGLFDKVIVNTDSDDIAALATAWNAEVFRRDPALGSDTATGDDFTADFMRRTGVDTVVMISPVCPLVSVDDIKQAVEMYRASDCDTLITCEKTQMQTFCEDKPVNIDDSQPLAPSQENPIVKVLNWAVTIWNSETFLASYEKNKSGYLGTKRLLMPIDPVRATKVSYESDFEMVEQLMLSRSATTQSATYWNKQD